MRLQFVYQFDSDDDTYMVLAPESDGTMHLIAHVGACDCLGVSRRQYARLLSSAPALLEQCQRLYAFLTEPGGPGAAPEMLGALALAIDKAKGDPTVYDG